MQGLFLRSVGGQCCGTPFRSPSGVVAFDGGVSRWVPLVHQLFRQQEHADEDHGDAGDPGHGAGGCGPRSQHHTGAGAYAGVDHGTAGYVDQPKRHDLPRNGPRTVGIRELWQQRQEQEEELRVQSADPCALQYLPDP